MFLNVHKSLSVCLCRVLQSPTATKNAPSSIQYLIKSLFPNTEFLDGIGTVKSEASKTIYVS